MIAAIPSVKSAGPEGLAGFAENALKTLEKQELKFQESFVKGLDPGGDLLKTPKFLKDQFARWDQQFTRPEDIALVAALKKQILEISAINKDVIRDKVVENTERLKLELAMKAVSKTTQGLQQLLSAQ